MQFNVCELRPPSPYDPKPPEICVCRNCWTSDLAEAMAIFVVPDSNNEADNTEPNQIKINRGAGKMTEKHN